MKKRYQELKYIYFFNLLHNLFQNSVPLPTKSALERTSELRIQFPVSSGQHHRKGEEWLPVSPPTEKEPDALPSGASLVSTVSTSSIPLPIEPAPVPAQPPPLPVKEIEKKPLPLPPVDPPTVPAPPNAPPGPQLFPTPLNQVSKMVIFFILQNFMVTPLSGNFLICSIFCTNETTLYSIVLFVLNCRICHFVCKLYTVRCK